MDEKPRPKKKKKRKKKKTNPYARYTYGKKGRPKPEVKEEDSYHSEFYDDLEDPFQSRLRLMGYNGKGLILKALSDFCRRLKRLNINI